MKIRHKFTEQEPERTQDIGTQKIESLTKINIKPNNIYEIWTEK